MRATLLGTRGSVGRAGPTTVRYGGDTSSLEVAADDGSVLLLDAGSGVVHASEEATAGPVHILLTHLHMDHIQGLGFLSPLFDPNTEVHIWAPSGGSRSLAAKLGRYLSPPLFPVRLRDIPELVLHELRPGTITIGPFEISSDFIIHPGRTFGYRISVDGKTLAYLPDHEPVLGAEHLTAGPMWTSGYELARDVDVLIHDAQYTDDEYRRRIGWGHSTLTHAADFAELAAVKCLVPFHHEPDHSDELIDQMLVDIAESRRWGFTLEPGLAGAVFEL